MKHLIAVLLCLLLCGCGQASPAQPESPPDVPVMAELYDPNHPLEKAYPGVVRAFPLPLSNVHGICVLGNDVLVLSGQDSTTLTLYTGDKLLETACLALDFPLRQEDFSLRIQKSGISFFDPTTQETILLDHRLQEIRRIAAPTGLSGRPILSSDGKILYYCTSWSVVGWDLESGIRRTVKELSHEDQALTGLHLEDQVLECTVRDNEHSRKLFLSADQGLEIQALSEDAQLYTEHNRYCSTLTRGFQPLLIFGSTDSAPQLLLPLEHWQQQFYLPKDHASVTVHTFETGIQLNYYELNTGILRAVLELEGHPLPKSIVNTDDHGVYILCSDPATDGEILYRWDVLRQPPDPQNITSYTAEYHSPENPDLQALEGCKSYAEAIGRKYGITVHVWEDAVSVQPWDYRFEAESLAPVLQRELTLLDQRLDQYPEAVLQQTKAHFAELTICLVGQITGTGDEGSLQSATGIQFFEGNQAYVVITTGKYSRQALYHELYHVMQTHILTESTALDQWETLNPRGFTYGEKQNMEIYLQGQTRAFVDRYSMIAAKEDQARILENAMLPGKKELFQSEYMQRKLSTICTGIRESYRLKQHPESLPWEQYLVTHLTPNA